MKYFYQIIIFIIFCCDFFDSTAQTQIPVLRDSSSKRYDSSAAIHISSIYISGNRKTKKYIIIRELPFKAGDTLIRSNLLKDLEQARQNIYNTTLFSEVDINPLFKDTAAVEINITVKEKWYIYPTPQFQLTDRNFNEWINVYNADLKRVIYGAKFAHYNLSGRRDRLRIYLLNGYARNFAVIYNAPYSNIALSEGFAVSSSFTQNKEIIYKTSPDNKLLRYSNEGFARTNFSSAISYLRRIDFFRKHTFSIGFTQVKVIDTILTADFNPGYFNSNSNTVRYPELSYAYQYSNTDNINYPLKGKAYSVGLTKRGTGFTGERNMFLIDADYNRYVPHHRNWYSSFQLITKLRAPFTQPYINQRALGYGQLYLRGLENYVIDGVASSLAKYSLRKKILSFYVPVPFKNKFITRIPFTFYGKTFADGGYVYNKKEFDTRLNDCLLYTGGFGLDILSLYDLNLKVEYSFNQLGEKGLFLHAKGGF